MRKEAIVTIEVGSDGEETMVLGADLKAFHTDPDKLDALRELLKSCVDEIFDHRYHATITFRDAGQVPFFKSRKNAKSR